MQTLKPGDTGSAVRDAQRFLGIDQSACFDGKTQVAVVAFQKKAGLLDDGVIGPRTWAVLMGKHDPRSLKRRDMETAAERLGVPLAVVQAVAEVESTGEGFFPDGRPKILFERHVFFRRLKESKKDADGLAKRFSNLVHPLRGGYAGGTAEWSRLNQACGIDKALALESASWGRFQVMGYHWGPLGYESASAFASAMHESEGAHLDAFVLFIEKDAALHKALKAGKWADFARRYNGPAFEENLYDIKLARAHARYAGIKAEKGDP